MSCDLTICVTCYNEEQSIVETLGGLMEALSGLDLSVEIIVVDDVSSDGSAGAVEQFAHDHGKGIVTLHRNAENQGLVLNVLETARRGQGRYYWAVGGDNPLTLEATTALISEVGRADIVIPNVLAYSGRKWHRRVISNTYVRLVNMLSGYPIRYYNGSSIYQRADVVRFADTIKGFSYSAELIISLLDEGKSYVEVPVRYMERTHGKSSALRFKHFVAVGAFYKRLLFRRLAMMVGRHRPERATAVTPQELNSRADAQA